MYTFSAKKMGKGTDNKIRKNLIISCLVELIAEQLRGKNVEMQKVSVKSQLEEHLSAKLVVKIIQDLHERLNSKAKAEFAVNLLADVQLLRNGKIPSAASQAENILPGAIAAISQLIPGHTQAEIASTGPTLASASSSTPTAASTPPSNKQKSEQAQSKPEAKTKTKPDAVEEKPKSNPNPKSKPDPEQQEPKSQQPEVANSLKHKRNLHLQIKQRFPNLKKRREVRNQIRIVVRTTRNVRLRKQQIRWKPRLLRIKTRTQVAILRREKGKVL